MPKHQAVKRTDFHLMIKRAVLAFGPNGWYSLNAWLTVLSALHLCGGQHSVMCVLQLMALILLWPRLGFFYRENPAQLLEFT